MSERDYSKQVAKRQRIRSTSLVVGVDVGKICNAVGLPYTPHGDGASAI